MQNGNYELFKVLKICINMANILIDANAVFFNENDAPHSFLRKQHTVSFSIDAMIYCLNN
jgi:hypothetical protein